MWLSQHSLILLNEHNIFIFVTPRKHMDILKRPQLWIAVGIAVFFVVRGFDPTFLFVFIVIYIVLSKFKDAKLKSSTWSAFTNPAKSDHYDEMSEPHLKKSNLITWKIWWKDSLAEKYSGGTFTSLVLDEEGIHYKDKLYKWQDIKTIEFVFKKSQSIAQQILRAEKPDFIPGGKRLLRLKTREYHRLKNNYVRVVDVQGFLEILQKKYQMHKFQKRKL